MLRLELEEPAARGAAYHFRGLSYEKLGNSYKANQDRAKAKELGFDGP